jgi:hypothetical protein
MNAPTRLRNRINKAMSRDRRRQRKRPDEPLLNAFEFVMDVNRAILKTVSELTVEFDEFKQETRRGRPRRGRGR